MLGDSRPSVIKVDVEGHEANVFLGAKRVLTGPEPPHIIFEFCDWAGGRATQLGEAQRVLMSYGYQIWRLDDYTSKKRPLSKPITSGLLSLVAVRN